MLNKILDWLYPPKCLICSHVIPIKDITEYNKEETDETICFSRWFCLRCQKELFQFIQFPTCDICGSPLEDEQSFCFGCHKKKKYFTFNRAVFEYDGWAKSLIYKLKYDKQLLVGRVLGKIMAKKINVYFPSVYEKIDYIVPVPISKFKKIIRGFNQAEILALEVSKATGIPIAPDFLIRVKNTLPQARLNPSQRGKNVSEAFAINKKCPIKCKRILLIDDIYTTGSTVQECSRLLIEGGVLEVYCYNLSIAVKRNYEA